MQIDMDSNLTTQIALIENADKDYGEYYYVASKVIHNNKMFLSIGYDSGTIGAYTDSKLYCVDLTSNDLKLLDTNVTKEFKLHNNSLYYQEYSLEEMVSTVKKVDLDTLKITEINNSNGEINITDNLVTDRNGEVVYIYGIYSTNKVLVSKEDKDEFKEKYAVNLSENDILIQVREVQKVNNKIYFLLEISKHNPDGDIGWRESYERIASEMYSYDLSNDTKSLVYLYKATDLIENMSGDSSANDEEVLAPLGENEMYLDIRLKDKGLKDTFDVRVEEVGGLIIGKRIEYEGTHSRAEEMITIKVTKEIGAMLSVYIDDKLDSQMLITEE